MKKKELVIGSKAGRTCLSKKDDSSKLASTSSNRKKYETLESRMAPSGLIQFINSGLSRKQISDIDEMGFGGLLKIKTDKIPGHLAHWLLCTFDPVTSSIMDKKLAIRDEDVHLATGLPIGGIKVEIASTKDKTDEFVAAINSFKSQFAGIEKVTNKQILEIMIKQREGGDDFKRNFVVYIVSTMLMGVKGVYASLRVLKCLSNVNLISKMDWCLFTRENMIESVLQWRKEKEIEERGGAKKFYKGPILILLFIYLDRVVFKVRTVPRVFPTLCTWTKESISSRVSIEKEASCFGTGFVDIPIVKVETYKETNKDIVAVPEDRNEDRDEKKRSRLKSCIENLATSGKGLAEAFDNFTKAVNEAKEEMPKSDAVGQMSALAESMLEGFNLTPPKKQDIGSQEKERNIEVGESSKSINDDAPTSPCVNPTIDNFDDPCWDDEVFLDAVEALCKAFCKEPVVEGKDGIDECKATVVEVQEVEVEAADPVVDGDDSNVVVQPKAKRRRVAKGPSMPSFDLLSSQEPSQDKVDCDSKKEEKENATTSIDHEDCAMEASPIQEEQNHNDFQSSHTQKEKNEKSVVAFTTPPVRRQSRRLSGSPHVSPLDITPLSDVRIEQVEGRQRCKRNVSITNLYKSPFLQRSIDIFGDLTQIEKDVADFAFGECFNDSETVFKWEALQLTRFDMKCLISNEKFSTDLINCWGQILNKKEDLKAPSSPLRVYAIVTSDGISCPFAFDYENLGLMFFPFTYREPILICINFLYSKIEIIHPMKNKSIIYIDFVEIVKEFIVEEMIPKSKKFTSVAHFKVEEYIPKSNTIEEIDFGIHLMRNMEMYNGNRRSYNNGLSSNVRPSIILENKLKVKYCHALLTFSQNEFLNQIHLCVKNLKMSLKQKLAGKSVDYSDDYLLTCAFNGRKSELAKFEALVDTEYGQVTRIGMSTLRPRQWVMDMVIDMFGIFSTISKPHCLYIPTNSKFADSSKHSSIGGQYIKMRYMPSDGVQIKKVFMPMSLKNHWFLCISDFEEKIVYILDSLRGNCDESEKYEAVSEVINNVAEILAKRKEYEHFLEMMTYQHDHVNVPEQRNGYDCGLYVLKWLEVGDDKSQWRKDALYKNFDAYRKEVAIKLLRWEENRRKVF